MSIFGSIVSKIFGHSSANAAPGPSGAGGTAPPASSSPGSLPTGTIGASSFNNPGQPSVSPAETARSTPAAATGQQSTPSSSAQSVDVEAVLNGLASKNPQKLDWRHSIVDMMKLLGLDSTLSARQELAKELQYSGSMDDSAAMNVWLHKQVMQKLAENGGKVPDDLR